MSVAGYGTLGERAKERYGNYGKGFLIAHYGKGLIAIFLASITTIFIAFPFSFPI